MTAPQDVLRRMIAEATEEAPGWIPLQRLNLHDLAPVLAQHLAEALDHLEMWAADDEDISELFERVERDLSHPETAA